MATTPSASDSQISGELSMSSDDLVASAPPAPPPVAPPKLPPKLRQATPLAAAPAPRNVAFEPDEGEPVHHRRRPRGTSWFSPREIALDIKEWFVTQGLWWAASTVAHALVLATTLLLLGTTVAQKIHSVAPAFEAAGVSTEIGEPLDLESFTAVDDTRMDPADLSATGSTSGDSSTAINGGGGEPGAAATPGFVGVGGPATGPSAYISGRGGGATGGGGVGGVAGSLASIDIRSVVPNIGSGKGKGGPQGRRKSSAMMGGVVSAGDVSGAVDGLIGGIKREGEAGDLLVVWLVDGSISLVDDRQKIAERIEPFFNEIERRGKSAYKLHNAVVAFGETTVEVVKPTYFSAKLVAAIRDLPIDGSGKENTMTSIEQVIEEYGKKWKGGMLIVLWTDESGDDVLKLEETIYTCRRRNVAVNVVGPTAVLGSERGTHFYVDKPTGFEFLLPVKRGPDTSLPERLLLPYWHDSPLAPWIREGAQVARGVPWYGGPHREGLLSGVGPYALTRLALETGGQFILLDRKEDRSQFEMAVMKKYLPDYKAAGEYLKTVQSSTLRKTIQAAVMATYNETNLIPPSTAFVLHRHPNYPYNIVNTYHTPAQFRVLVKEEVPKQQALVAAVAQIIEKSLAHFPAAGMESEYAAERSPRWRAWYDITRGRLLAMSIRHLEYQLACEKVLQPGFFAPETNRVDFKPSAEYRSGSITEARAREALRLLTRCRDENPGTPWALLADWELKHELGIEIVQVVRPIPPPGRSPPPDPPIKFPNL